MEVSRFDASKENPSLETVFLLEYISVLFVNKCR